MGLNCEVVREYENHRRMIYRNPAVPIMLADAMTDYDLIAVDEDKIREMAEVIRKYYRGVQSLLS